MLRHRRIRFLVAGLILVVGRGVAGPFIYIHFIAGPPKPKLTLPKSKTTRPSSPGAATLTGTWSATSGSKAGYRVQEESLGQDETAVGRTPDVSGALALEGTVLRSARFSVPLATVVSDQSERNAKFNGSIMDVARYPTATFDLTSPVSIGQLPPPDKIVTTAARGDLTMHGVTHSLSLRISAKQAGTSIWVLANATVVFADWHLRNPSIGGFATTASQGTLQVLLHLGCGAVPTTTVPKPGPPGDVTIPATTLPPLSIKPKR